MEIFDNSIHRNVELSPYRIVSKLSMNKNIELPIYRIGRPCPVFVLLIREKKSSTYVWTIEIVSV